MTFSTSSTIAASKAAAADYRATQLAAGEVLTLCQAREKYARTRGYRSWAALCAKANAGGSFEIAPRVSLRELRYANLATVQHKIGAEDLRPYDIPPGEVPFWTAVTTFADMFETRQDEQDGCKFVVTPIGDDDVELSTENALRFEREQHRLVVARFARFADDECLVLYASSRKAQLAFAHSTAFSREIKSKLEEMNDGMPELSFDLDLHHGLAGTDAPYVGARFVATRSPFPAGVNCPWPVRAKGRPFVIEDIDPFDRTVSFRLCDMPQGGTKHRLNYELFNSSFALADEFGD